MTSRPSTVRRPRRWQTAIGMAAVATVAAGLATAPTVTAAERPPLTAASTPAHTLFTASTDRARLTRTPEGVRLTLPARTAVTWFTDRPARHTGRTTLARVVSTWTAVGFDADPPQAALLLTDDRGRERIHVVTLSDPRRVGSWVRATVVAAPDWVEAGYAHLHGLKQGRYEAATLLIDDEATPPCASIVTAETECLLTNGPVSFRSVAGNVIGTVTACGADDSRTLPWRVRARATYVEAGAVIHDESLFPRGTRIPACAQGPMAVTTVFPSDDARTFAQVTISNASYTATDASSASGRSTAKRSLSPVLLRYTMAPE